MFDDDARVAFHDPVIAENRERPVAREDRDGGSDNDAIAEGQERIAILKVVASEMAKELGVEAVGLLEGGLGWHQDTNHPEFAGWRQIDRRGPGSGIRISAMRELGHEHSRHAFSPPLHSKLRWEVSLKCIEKERGWKKILFFFCHFRDTSPANVHFKILRKEIE